MKISVRVVPHAKAVKIEPAGECEYKVWLTKPPQKGEANKQLVELLAKHFGVGKRNVELVKGGKSRVKEVLIFA